MYDDKGEVVDGRDPVHPVRPPKPSVNDFVELSSGQAIEKNIRKSHLEFGQLLDRGGIHMPHLKCAAADTNATTKCMDGGTRLLTLETFVFCSFLILRTRRAD